MKRVAVLFLFLTSAFVAIPTLEAASPRSDVPPILLNGENGMLDAVVYVGVGAENTSIPMMGTIPVRVCDGTDCEVYTANYMSDTEGYSTHRSITPRVMIGERFSKRPVTLQVPTDLKDSASGWSTASNAVTGWMDPTEWFTSRANRPILEVQFRGIDSASVTRADLCANYREGASLTTSVSGLSVFDLNGYTSARYVLIENGTQIKTEDLSSALTSMGSIPACGGGTMGSGLMKNIDGLTAGRSYQLVYTISGTAKPDVSATLDFIAPGACPTGEIVLPTSPRAFYFGLLGTDGTLKSYYATGTYPWRYESIVGERLAPIYFSASKVGPYKGNLYGVRENKEKWRYVREIDDWALVVDNAVPVTATNLLSYTVFADCTSTSIKPLLALDETKLPARDQACEIDGNEVVPTKIGQCIVRATVPASGVSASSAGKHSAPATVTMNYVFASIGSFTRTTSVPTAALPATTTPATSKTSAAKRCSFTLTKGRTTATSQQLMKCAGVKLKRGQSVVVKVSASSKKVCSARGATVRRMRKGTCTATVSVRTGKKVVTIAVVAVRVI